MNRTGGRLDLGQAEAAHVMNGLPVQIGEVYAIVVNQDQPSNTTARQVQRSSRTQSAQPNHQRAAVFHTCLGFEAPIGQ